jgi:chromosome segregation ATPase
MMTDSYTDLRGLENKLETAEQALADVTKREQSLAAKLRAYQALSKLPASLGEAQVQLEEQRLAGEKADRLRSEMESDLARRIAEFGRREAELRCREAEMEAAEKEALLARSEAGVLQKQLAHERAELDAGRARLSAVADGIMLAQRENKIARAAIEERSAALDALAADLERQRTALAAGAPDDGVNTPRIW